MMAVGEEIDDEDEDWILDSSFSRHLVVKPYLLRDARDCDQECVYLECEDGTSGRSSKSKTDLYYVGVNPSLPLVALELHSFN